MATVGFNAKGRETKTTRKTGLKEASNAASSKAGRNKVNRAVNAGNWDVRSTTRTDAEWCGERQGQIGDVRGRTTETREQKVYG